jgi:2,3-bisphosphoglycerate-dependent phosphoglycerate mutase
VTRILLVRHAQSVPPSVGGPGESERPLTDAGIRQAEQLVPVLAAAGASRVLSSPYLRAVQTVEPTARAGGLVVERRDELREWVSGLEPRPDWQARYRDAWTRPTAAFGAGETHEALTRRAVRALEQIRDETTVGETVVVGSHGTWISRALLGLGCPVDADFWFAMPMPAVYEVVLGGRSPRVSGPGLDG